MPACHRRHVGIKSNKQPAERITRGRLFVHNRTGVPGLDQDAQALPARR
jgi:hypothetical protein